MTGSWPPIRPWTESTPRGTPTQRTPAGQPSAAGQPSTTGLPRSAGPAGPDGPAGRVPPQQGGSPRFGGSAGLDGLPGLGGSPGSHPAGCGCERIDELTAELRARCAGALDADEVAAVLEAAGIGDRAARQTYRQPHVFALAEQVYKRLGACGPPGRHAAAPVRWDWRGLGRPALIGTRLILAVAITVAGLWLGSSAVLPALVAVPLAELLVSWQQGHARWGLAAYDTVAAWRRHLRAVGWATLTALVPPLLVAVALLAASSRLPADLPQAGPGLLRAGTGMLLGGGYALILLLAACGRPVTAAGLMLAATGAAVLIRHTVPAPAPQVGLLAIGYLAGLVVAAYTVLDPRSYQQHTDPVD